MPATKISHRMVATVFISLIPFTEAMRLVRGKAFVARANVPLHLVMTTGETAASAAAASARLAGPWRRTMYELYDWVSPAGLACEGNVQDEQVERATLEQQPCLGVVLSSVAEGAAWPRDDFLTGATLEFSFGPPPLGTLARLAPNHLNDALAFVLLTLAATCRRPHPPQVRSFARHWNWTRSLTRTRAWGTRYGALPWCSPSSCAALQGSPCSVKQAPPRAVREAAPPSRACWRSELGSACLGGTLRREARRARTHRSSAPSPFTTCTLALAQALGLALGPLPALATTLALTPWLGVASLVTLTDSRTKLVEQLARAEHATERTQDDAAASGGCPVQAVSMNWNSAEEVAEVAEAKYDICIATDVAYTAVQLLAHSPSPQSRLSTPSLSLSRSPTTRLTSRPSQTRCALSGLPPQCSSRLCTGEAHTHTRTRARAPHARTQA